MATTEGGTRKWLRRAGWLVLIWGLSVGLLAGLAGLIRLLMHLAMPNP